jgi:hypothetical protein
MRGRGAIRKSRLFSGYIEWYKFRKKLILWQEIFTSHRITLHATLWYFLLDSFYLIYIIIFIKVYIDIERHLSSIHFLKEGTLMKTIPFFKRIRPSLG